MGHLLEHNSKRWVARRNFTEFLLLRSAVSAQADIVEPVVCREAKYFPEREQLCVIVLSASIFVALSLAAGRGDSLESTCFAQLTRRKRYKALVSLFSGG